MKALLLATLALLLTFTSAPAQVQNFTSNSGEAIKATLVSHSGGKVRIRRVDGREFDIDPSAFCQQDEKTIRKWMLDHEATVRYDLTVQADKKVMDRSSTTYSSETSWSYEVSITNNSQLPATKLKVLYRVLYFESSDRMMEGDVSLDDELKFNRSMVFATRPVTLYKSREGGSSRNNGLKGCLVRVVDQNDKVVLDWVSTDVGMKGKTWENTKPRNDCDGGGGGVIIR